MDYIIETKSLSKIYGRQKALDNVSIHVPKGSIYGLIGSNGAGKTTILKIISGLAKQTDGTYELFGNSKATPSANIGTLIEAPGIYPKLSAMENMRIKCLTMGIKDKNLPAKLLEIVGLADTGKKAAGKFSLGMKQRLGMALALIGKPELVILDEPINGLDPEGIIEVRDMISRLNKEMNITFIISSHILEELSKIATNYGIIDKGRLLEELDSETLFSKCNDRIEIGTNDNENAIKVLTAYGVSDYKISEEGLINVFDQSDKSAEINSALVKEGIAVHHLCVRNESLENYYISLIGGKAGSKNA